MGFTPLKAFIGGGANFAQKVALARLEGEYELKKSLGIAKAKALADAPPSTSFKAGNVNLTFTNSEASDASARTQDNLTNMNTVLGTNNYQKFLKAAKFLPDGESRVQNLNTFLKGRIQPYIRLTAEEEKVGDTTKIVKYQDIIGTYSQYLDDGYGKLFIENVIAPSYNVEYERFQKKYGNKLGFLSNKKLTSDKYVSYEHIPYMTKSVYDSVDGKFIIQQANHAAKKLGTSYEKLLGAWQVGTGDDLQNVSKQKVIWNIYGQLRTKLPSEGVDLENFASYTQFISQARKTAYDNGVSPDQFANMLQAFVTGFNSTDTLPYIYKTTSAKAEAIRKEQVRHLKDQYKIDPEEAGVKANAARQATGIASRMILEFRRNQQVVGQGGLQPTVAGTATSIEGIFGTTGILAGFNTLTSWLNDKKGFNKNQATRSRLQNKLTKYRNQYDEKDNNGELTQNARKARIEFMKFNLAYAMASAFQGGTGGRTISDQDIENMMAAMNFSWDSSEDIIIESLKTISSVMRDVAVIQDGYRKGGKAAAVSYMLEKTNEAFGVDFALGGNYAQYAVKKLGGGTPQGLPSIQTKTIKNPNWKPNSPSNIPKWIQVPINTP